MSSLIWPICLIPTLRSAVTVPPMPSFVHARRKRDPSRNIAKIWLETVRLAAWTLASTIWIRAAFPLFQRFAWPIQTRRISTLWVALRSFMKESGVPFATRANHGTLIGVSHTLLVKPWDITVVGFAFALFILEPYLNFLHCYTSTFTGADPIFGEEVVDGSGRIWLDQVGCYGNTLAECAYGEWGEVDCDHTQDVGVKCWLR